MSENDYDSQMIKERKRERQIIEKNTNAKKLLQLFNLKSSQYFVSVKKRLYKRLYCIRDCIVKREKIFFEMNLYCCGVL